MRTRNRTRQELCDAVYQAVAAAAAPLSRLEICKALGYKKSAHVVNMIEELAAGGWLVKEAGSDPWQRPTWKYRQGREIGDACL
jgi:hypothetical protein